jgi:1,4-dihydroxy-2-naphthoate octaprenyltransferase
VLTLGASAWLLLPLLTIPLAVPIGRLVNTASGAPLNHGLAMTGRLLVAYGMLYSLGWVLGR